MFICQHLQNMRIVSCNLKITKMEFSDSIPANHSCSNASTILETILLFTLTVLAIFSLSISRLSDRPGCQYQKQALRNQQYFPCTTFGFHTNPIPITSISLPTLCILFYLPYLYCPYIHHILPVQIFHLPFSVHNPP